MTIQIKVTGNHMQDGSTTRRSGITSATRSGITSATLNVTLDLELQLRQLLQNFDQLSSQIYLILGMVLKILEQPLHNRFERIGPTIW